MNINIHLDNFNIDKRIKPLFRTPVVLKKIFLLKKYKNKKLIVIQKKLIFRVKPLNEKLVKYTDILKNYKKNINKVILTNNNSSKKIKYLFLRKDDLSKLKIYLNLINFKLNLLLPYSRKK